VKRQLESWLTKDLRLVVGVGVHEDSRDVAIEPFAIPGFGHTVIYQGYPATNTCGTTSSSKRADRLGRV
jgi:hypothetical protein